MDRPKYLADRLREVLLNGRWIANTNYRDQLSQLSWEQARTAVGSLNTIAMLAYHIDYYLAGILQVFDGGDLEIRDRYSFDLPPLQGPGDWDELRTRLRTHAERFACHVEGMTEAELQEVFVDEKYGTYERNIEGVIEHSYYHLGQISLIRKLLEAGTKS